MTQTPFELIGPAEGNLLLVADHASNHIPDDLCTLGLEDRWLANHIAYDIGTDAVARAMSARLGARAILARFSRLIVDANRPLDHESLIPQMSDGIFIPGNADLTEEARDVRISHFYTPYHEAIETEVNAIRARGAAPRLVSIHSFTPRMNGQERRWQTAILWNRDERLADTVATALEAHGDLTVGRNVPYSGKILNHTMDEHAEAHGIAYVTIEIRQDLIEDRPGADWWADLLSEVISTAVATLPL